MTLNNNQRDSKSLSSLLVDQRDVPTTWDYWITIYSVTNIALNLHLEFDLE